MNARRLIRSFADVAMAALMLALAKPPVDAEAAPVPGPDDPPFWRLIVEPLPFERRIWHGVVVHDDKLWVLGGNARDSWLNDVWSSPDGVTWTQVTPAAPWSPRSQHQCLAHDGKLWVIGGYDGTLRNDVWTSVDGKQWELVIEAAPWSARSDFRAEVFNGRLVVMGGQEDWRRLNDVWASGDGRTWECLTPAAPWPERTRFASVVHKGRLFIATGSFFEYDKWFTSRSLGYYDYRADLWVTDDGATWTQLVDKGEFGRRVDAQMVSVGDYILMTRSGDNPLSHHVSRSIWFSKDGTKWDPLQRPSPGWRDEDGRVYWQPVVFCDRVWQIGGGSQAYAFITFYDNIRALEGVVRPLEEQISSKRD